MGLAIWWVIYTLHSRLYSRLPDASRQSDFWERVEAQEKRGPTGPLRTLYSAYSPECVEGKFSEVGLPLYAVLRSSLMQKRAP
jgi:hypothetical protein